MGLAGPGSFGGYPDGGSGYVKKKRSELHTASHTLKTTKTAWAGDQRVSPKRRGVHRTAGSPLDVCFLNTSRRRRLVSPTMPQSVKRTKQTRTAPSECILLTTRTHSDCSSLRGFKHSFEMIYNSLSSTKTLLLSRSSCVINSPARAALIVVLITPLQLTSCLPLLLLAFFVVVFLIMTPKFILCKPPEMCNCPEVGRIINNS